MAEGAGEERGREERCGARRGGAGEGGKEGEGARENEGCAEMQIFARKLITRINSSQNIQTGCQTVRLHTPTPVAPSQTPHILPLSIRLVHRLAGVMRARPIQCTYYLSAGILWQRQTDYVRICRTILFRLIIKGCRQSRYQRGSRIKDRAERSNTLRRGRPRARVPFKICPDAIMIAGVLKSSDRFGQMIDT